jgi:hypothetical protein
MRKIKLLAFLVILINGETALKKQIRLTRERQTIRVMIGIFCKGYHHARKSLCLECSDLLDYSMHRIDKCPHKEKKPVCAKCPVHCYTPDMRKRVRDVMRYAGPRMMFYHPLLAVLHLIDAMVHPVIVDVSTRRTRK